MHCQHSLSMFDYIKQVVEQQGNDVDNTEGQDDYGIDACDVRIVHTVSHFTIIGSRN